LKNKNQILKLHEVNILRSTNIAIHSWYPFSKIQDVQIRLAEITEEKGTSDAIKSILSWSSATDKGFHAVAYHEVEEGNLEEAMNYLGEFMSGFWTIEGYTYRIDIALSPKQAMDFATRMSKYSGVQLP
jgi:hypothetical protein